MSAKEKKRRASERRRRQRRARRHRSTALHALTSSALALPGVAGSAKADGPSDRFRADYGFSYYVEDDLDSSKLAAGSPERYEIFMHQFRLQAPVTDRIDLGLDVVHETMSGASPWYVTPDTDGTPIQVMTGATIEDARTDALVSGQLYFANALAKAGAGISVENDYLAFNGNFGGEMHFNDKNTTLSGGAGFSVDRIEPADADTDPFRPELENKWSTSLVTGVSQVFGESTVLQSSFTYKHSNGFLSDPYKRVIVEGNQQADSRPDMRNQFSFLTRFRQHVRALNGTLHTDYQFYVDDWEMTSHTLELAWYQTLFDHLRLTPSFRYYTQSATGFYAPYYLTPRSDGYHSSDYRLSPFGAISGRIKAEALFTTGPLDWLLAASYERYTSSADFAIGKVELENPGLVSFHLVSVSLTGRF